MGDLWSIVVIVVFFNFGWWLIYEWFLSPKFDRLTKEFDAACDSLEGRIMRTNAERDAALAEVERLKAAIRNHRDQRGDSRCWLDDAELYGVLGDPESRAQDSSLPPRDEFLESCRRFYERRRAPQDSDPTPGCMTIAELEAEVERLKAELAEAHGRDTS